MSEIITFAPSTASGHATFAVPFPYIDKAHVHAYVNGVEDTNFQWISDGAIVLSVSLTDGDTVVVRRETPRSALITEVPTSGTLKGSDLNEQSLQAVYVATEAADGLREGLSLDLATETYWEAAPYGINRTMKDVANPSNNQDAATKGWYDAEVDTQTSAAASSASNAASSASAAVASKTTATSAATTAATAEATATAAATTASTAATTASTAATGASDAQTWAENWAIRAEDSLVPVSMGADGVTEYSAYHWAQKAAADATSASNAATLAAAAQAAAAKHRATQLIPFGETNAFAVNGRSGTVTMIDGDGVTSTTTGSFFDKEWRDWWVTDLAGSYTILTNTHRFPYRDGTWNSQSNHQPRIYNPFTLYPVGLAYLNRNDSMYCGSPKWPGNTVYYWTRQNVTWSNTHTDFESRATCINGTKPSRITINSISSAEAYIRSDMKVSVSSDMPAGVKLFQVQTTYDSWQYLKVVLETASETWSAVLDIQNGSVVSTSGNWDRSNEFYILENASVPNTYFFTAQFTTDNDEPDATNNAYLYFCDVDGVTTVNGNGTDKYYCGYFVVRDIGHIWDLSTGTVPGAYNAIISGDVVKASAPLLDQYIAAYQAKYAHYSTDFYSFYIPDGSDLSTSSAMLLCPWVRHTTVGAWYHLIGDQSTQGTNLTVVLQGNTGSPGTETWDTGIDIASSFDPFDNDGMGTYVQIAIVNYEHGSGTVDTKVFVKINGGTTQTATHAWTASVAGPITNAPNAYRFASTGSNSASDYIQEYFMRFSRPFSDDEVDELFKY